MNFLLIGHEGYLGRGLFSYLSRRHRVLGYDIKENLFSLNSAFLAREGVEAVINLAVMADRQSRNYQVDAPTDEVNVCGARHLGRILKGSDIAWFQISTREVFGPVYGPKDVVRTKVGYRPKFLVDETFPYAPQNFYGKSKLVAEILSESHPRSNIIRLTTCYTDFDHSRGNWVIQMLKTTVQGRPVSLTRNGRQFRDPLHVDDLGRLIERLLDRGICGEKINAGGGKENVISLMEFLRLADANVRIERIPGGDYGFAFHNGKAFRLTGWKPEVRIREKIPVIVKNIRHALDSTPVARTTDGHTGFAS